MSDGALIGLVFLAFAIGFPLFWMAIIWIIARLGGWRRLARQYRAEEPASGDHFRFASVQLGWFTSYSNCLNISVSSRGFYLHPFILLRTGHDPLFLPWDAVASLSRGRFLGFTSVRMAIEDKEGGSATRLVLYGKDLADSLMRHAPSALHD